MSLSSSSTTIPILLHPPSCSFPLQATHFTPSTSSSTSNPTSSKSKYLPLPPAVLFIPATGVHAAFYSKYANYLAKEKDCVSLIFDYRFVGKSFPSYNLKGEDLGVEEEQERRRDVLKGKEGRECTYDEWIEDTETALEWLISRFGTEREIIVVCNSVGGHLFALVKPILLQKVKRCLFMGVFSPWHDFFEEHIIKRRVFAERAIEADELGYYPGRIHGFGSDLSLGVFKEWTGNMEFEMYWVHEDDKSEKVKRCKVEILSIHLMDDKLNEGKVLMTDTSLLAIPNAPATRIIIDPAKLNWEEIGHINSFLPKHSLTIWKVMNEYILEGTIRKDVIEDRRDFRGGINLEGNRARL